jgi:hypothetical protein
MARKKVIREIPLSSGGESSENDVPTPKEPKLPKSAKEPAKNAPANEATSADSAAPLAPAAVATKTEAIAVETSAKEPPPPPIVKHKAEPKRLRELTDKRIESLRAANEARVRIKIEREMELKRIEKEQQEREMEQRVQKMVEKHWREYSSKQQQQQQQQQPKITQRSYEKEDDYYEGEDEYEHVPQVQQKSSYTLINRSKTNQPAPYQQIPNPLFSQIFGR